MCRGYRPRLLLRLVRLLVAQDTLTALPNLIGRPVGLLVSTATGPLVNLFLTPGQGVVRLVAEPLLVNWVVGPPTRR